MRRDRILFPLQQLGLSKSCGLHPRRNGAHICCKRKNHRTDPLRDLCGILRVRLLLYPLLRRDADVPLYVRPHRDRRRRELDPPPLRTGQNAGQSECAASQRISHYLCFIGSRYGRILLHSPRARHRKSLVEHTFRNHKLSRRYAHSAQKSVLCPCLCRK